MEKDFPQILEKLSWPNGVPIPVANAENQALQKEFQRLILLKSKAKGKNEKIKSRFKELKSQQKYLSQEKEQNQVKNNLNFFNFIKFRFLESSVCS